LEVYDPASNIWKGLAAMPTGLSAPAVVAMYEADLDEVLYVMGGDSSAGVGAATLIYHWKTDTWTNANAMPVALGNAGGVTLYDGAYVMGGNTDIGGVSNVAATFEQYDPTYGLWSSEPSMPTARTGLVAAAVGSGIYAIGGQQADGTILSTNEAFVFPEP
jgi:N-acetylneuraminic acid mutarotase